MGKALARRESNAEFGMGMRNEIHRKENQAEGGSGEKWIGNAEK
jgi:hypothetical protein